MKLVSACLVGVACRYDGRCRPDPDLVERFAGGGLYPVCPEVMGGLSVPRESCEIGPGGGGEVLGGRARVRNRAGVDVTDAFVAGARATLALARTIGACEALLADLSPSCGSGEIYDGVFSGKVVLGDGVTAALLRQNGLRITCVSRKAPRSAVETERLVLRAFAEGDGPDLHEYLSDRRVYVFEPGGPVDLVDARRIASERAKAEEFWAVELKGSGKLIGQLYFARLGPERLGTYELGYIFNPAFWGRGYASEAARALVGHAFSSLGAHRVVAGCNPRNAASWRLLERIGMRREGLQKADISFRDGPDGSPLWLDSYRYAMLAEDLSAAGKARP